MLPETLARKLCALDQFSQLGPRDVEGKRDEATIGSRLYLFRRHVLRGRKQLVGNMRRRLDPFIVCLGKLEDDTLKRKHTEKSTFGEWEWHTDMSYIKVPPTFSLLHSRIIPKEGGDMSFCSQVMAAKALPVDLRERVRKLSAKNDLAYGSSGKICPGMTPPASPVEALCQVHPILRKVPTTGGEAIYLGNGYIIGLPLKESEALLDEL